MRERCVVGVVAAACGAAGAWQGPVEIDLGDPGVVGTSAEVEYSSRGRINWRDVVPTGPWGTDENGNQKAACLFTAGWPELQPYGDVLGYSGGGVGDVDGDGYGDFATTWYHAEQRYEPCDAYTPDPGTEGWEDVGFVRVISGNPNHSLCEGHGSPPCPDQPIEYDTHNNHGAGFDHNIRRIGEDFWGFGNRAIWAHEITTIGDLDGDGRDEMVITHNEGGGGVAQVWAFTSRYNLPASGEGDRWIKLIEVSGIANSARQDQFGYQAYLGPLPEETVESGGISSSGFDLDFNSDGQADLLVASKWAWDRQLGHLDDRNFGAGAAWVFMMPRTDVFDEIERIQANSCDNTLNSDGSLGSDGVSDLLPLRLTTDDVNVVITGHQFLTAHPGNSTARPRWFGYGIDPAGDLDNDGAMDLVVSAPHHQSNWSVSSTPLTSEGAVYFFLSNSTHSLRPRGQSGVIGFNDLQPKHFLGEFPLLLDDPCAGLILSTLTQHTTTEMQASHQIRFTSEAADFVMLGSEAVADETGFASQFEGGVRLGGVEYDPDFAVFDGSPSHRNILVFLDLQQRLSSLLLTGHPTSTQVLWPPDHPTWLQSFGEPNAIIQREIPGGANPDLYVETGTGGPGYAAVSGVGLAGNFDGQDGDCELVALIGAGSHGQRAAVVNFAPVGQSGPPGVMTTVIWPEETGILLNNSQTNFNPIAKNAVEEGRLIAWPIWNASGGGDGKDDLLIGARGFPSQAKQYLPQGSGTWVCLPTWDKLEELEDGPNGVPNCFATIFDYNQAVTVPGGKVWLVRAP